MCLLERCLVIIGTLSVVGGLCQVQLSLLSGSGIKLQDRMLLAGRQLHLLKVRGWGQPYDMRVLDGPLNVFLEVQAEEKDKHIGLNYCHGNF